MSTDLNTIRERFKEAQKNRWKEAPDVYVPGFKGDRIPGMSPSTPESLGLIPTTEKR
jgi:hypothetical protein